MPKFDGPKAFFVGWLPNDRYWQGGSWAVFTMNNHLYLEPAKKGHDKRVKACLERLVAAYNALEQRT